MSIEINSWDSKTKLKVLKCPCCGGDPELKYIGNDFSKKRSIEIKCLKCRLKRKDSALTHSFLWLEEVCIRYWNKRF